MLDVMHSLGTCLLSGICPEVLTALVNHGACITDEMLTALDNWLTLAETNGRNSEAVQRFVKHYQNGEIRQIERLEI